jgi:hypothetical protein
LLHKLATQNVQHGVEGTSLDSAPSMLTILACCIAAAARSLPQITRLAGNTREAKRPARAPVAATATPDTLLHAHNLQQPKRTEPEAQVQWKWGRGALHRLKQRR